MLKFSRGWWAFAVTLFCATAGAEQLPEQGDRAAIAARICIDLSNVNDQGLRGASTGLRAVHYEFCIPSGQQYAAELRSIDQTAQFMPGSRGRIGCSGDQVLVLGSTHQPAYRAVLSRLAALDYVARITETFFE